MQKSLFTTECRRFLRHLKSARRDARLEEELARRLSQVVVASGTAWTDARDRDTACNALSAAVVALREDAAAEAR